MVVRGEARGADYGMSDTLFFHEHGAASAEYTVPTGIRLQFTIELPPGLPLLNSNGRIHYHRRAHATKLIRNIAFAAWRERCAGKALFERVHILGIVRLTSKRRADPANWYPSFKAAIDGLVDAGMVADDDSERVEGPDMRLGPVAKRQQIALVVTVLTSGERWPDFGESIQNMLNGGTDGSE